jgi:hypothetical protein
MRTSVLAALVLIGCTTHHFSYSTGPKTQAEMAGILDGADLWGGALRDGNTAYFVRHDAIARERDDLLRALLKEKPLEVRELPDFFPILVVKHPVVAVSYPPVLELHYSQATVRVLRRGTPQKANYELWLAPTKKPKDWMYIAVPESPELKGAWGRLRAAARGEAKRIPAYTSYPHPPEDSVWPEHGLALPR